MVVPDQIFDRTKGIRPSTFFGDGVVGHVAFADPFCADLRSLVVRAARNRGAVVHEGGTYICMEGPQFSTRAESHFYRRVADATVIGMTALPEAKLAREAEMCYAALSMGTDYDCWHEQEGDVEIESVLAILKANTQTANAVVRETSPGCFRRRPIANACTRHGTRSSRRPTPFPMKRGNGCVSCTDVIWVGLNNDR